MEIKKELGETETWCTILLDDKRIRASIKHTGAGKFRILNDNSEGQYIGLIIDASDILHCK